MNDFLIRTESSKSNSQLEIKNIQENNKIASVFDSEYLNDECSNKKRKTYNILSPEEVYELKEKLNLKRIFKKKFCQPTFVLNDIGRNAQLCLDDNARTPLFLSDIQSLLLFSLIGQYAPYQTRWCRLNKNQKVKKVALIILDGLNLDDFNDTDFNFLKSFNNQVEVLLPPKMSFSVMQELFFVPLSMRQKKNIRSIPDALAEGRIQIFKNFYPIYSKPESKKNRRNINNGVLTRTSLLLNAIQMLEEDFPLPLPGNMRKQFEDFQFSKSVYSNVTDDSPLIAIDCEMCLTHEGNELTRVALVAEDHSLIYHSFVLPKNIIKDYLTAYSGITKEMLKGVTTSLKDVQDAIINLLPPDAILVGQSLSNDLKALKLMHPYVIDTSVIFNITGSRSRKTKLSHLSNLFLNEQIQKEKCGHNPIEDCLAAMKLVQLKLKKGLSYGDILLNGEIPEMPEQYIPSKPDTFKTDEVKMKSSMVTNFFHYLEEKDNVSYIGPVLSTKEKPLLDNIQKVIYLKSLKNIFQVACAIHPDFNFMIFNLLIKKKDRSKEKWKTYLNKLDERIKNIANLLENDSLIIILFAGSFIPITWQNGLCLVHLKSQKNSK